MVYYIMHELITLNSFRKRSDDVRCDEFDWYNCWEELHVARMAILSTVQVTACAVPRNMVETSSSIRPVEGLSDWLIRTAQAGMACNCRVV